MDVQLAIEDTEREMLETLKACGSGWHGRLELAERLSKKKLNPAQIIALDLLASEGKIEKKIEPTDRIHINRWVYRAKEGNEP